MTVFTDLTGWREEKRRLENSDLWNRTFVDNPRCNIEHGIRTSSRAPLPVSLLLDFLETMIRNPDLKAALDAEYKWQRTPLKPDEEIDGDTDPRVPHNAIAMLTDFKAWYLMKTHEFIDGFQFYWVKDYYWRLKDFGVDDIRSARARASMLPNKSIDLTL